MVGQLWNLIYIHSGQQRGNPRASPRKADYWRLSTRHPEGSGRNRHDPPNRGSFVKTFNQIGDSPGTYRQRAAPAVCL